MDRGTNKVFKVLRTLLLRKDERNYQYAQVMEWGLTVNNPIESGLPLNDLTVKRWEANIWKTGKAGATVVHPEAQTKVKVKVRAEADDRSVRSRLVNKECAWCSFA